MTSPYPCMILVGLGQRRCVHVHARVTSPGLWRITACRRLLRADPFNGRCLLPRGPHTLGSAALLGHDLIQALLLYTRIYQPARSGATHDQNATPIKRHCPTVVSTELVPLRTHATAASLHSTFKLYSVLCEVTPGKAGCLRPLNNTRIVPRPRNASTPCTHTP